MSSTSIIEVAAGLVFREGRLLITQRHTSAHLGGLWEFPGGKKETEETWESCLARELMEELAIEVRIGPVVESLTHHYPEKSVHLRFFKCDWAANEPQTLQCPNFRWVTRSELRQYEFPAADAQLLNMLESRADWWQPAR